VGDHSFPTKQHNDACDVRIYLRRSPDERAKLIRCGRWRIRSSSRPARAMMVQTGRSREQPPTVEFDTPELAAECMELPCSYKNYQIHRSAGNTNFGSKLRDVACRVIGCAGTCAVPAGKDHSVHPPSQLLASSHSWRPGLCRPNGLRGPRCKNCRRPRWNNNFRLQNMQIVLRPIDDGELNRSYRTDSGGGDSGGNVGKKSSETLTEWRRYLDIPETRTKIGIPFCNESDRNRSSRIVVSSESLTFSPRHGP
jgi:hypothetical protein